MSGVNFYLPIAKIDREQRMVFGYASTPTRDLDGEVIELDAIKDALPDYMAWRNIREMHQPSAVGVTKEANVDDKGLYIGAKIVDDDAWKKVIEEVYKGFSIGGDVTRRDGATITGLDLIEISLVDRPANPDCRIDVVKAAGAARENAMADLSAPGGEVGWLRRMVEKLAGGGPSAGGGVEKADKKPYGDVEYADPGYQADKQKRYPIDTEEHIRAAWNYIHQARNADKYSAEQVASIKRRIVAAWKVKIGEDGPTEAKAAEPEDAEKRDAQPQDGHGSKPVDNDDEMRVPANGYEPSEPGPSIPAGRDGMSRPAKAAGAFDADVWAGEITRRLFGEAGDGAGNIGVRKMAEADLSKRAATGRHGEHVRKAAEHVREAAGCTKAAMECMAKAMDARKAAGDGADHLADAHEHLAMAHHHHVLAAHHLAKAAGERGEGPGDAEDGMYKPEGGLDALSQRELTEGNVPDYGVDRPYPGKAARAETISKREADLMVEAALLKGRLEALEKQPQSPRAKLFAVPRGSLPVGEAEQPSAMEKLFRGVNVEATNPAERQNAAARMIGNMVANSATFGRPVLTDPAFHGGAGR
ncbi:MAG: DUF6582 domain-containing protein [Acetobacteraceae bacterium]